MLDWVADHRKHHAHADKEGDPHSPHVGHGSGLRGLWHAHTGWLLETQGQADWKRYATELYEDPRMRRIGRRLPLARAGVARGPDRRSASSSTASRSRARSAATSGAGSCGSSSCTTSPGRSTRSATSSAGAGSTSRTSRPTSRGSPLLSFGESWHHNHHAFPRSAYHGLRWWEIDLSGHVHLDAAKLVWPGTSSVSRRSASSRRPRPRRPRRPPRPTER